MFVVVGSHTLLELLLSVVGFVSVGVVGLFIRWVLVHMMIFVASLLVFVVVWFVSCFRFWILGPKCEIIRVLGPRCEVVLEVEIMVVVGCCVFVELEWVGLLVEVLFVIIFGG